MNFCDIISIMGKQLIDKIKENIETVKKQLYPRNATYSIQYSWITNDELKSVLNAR